ncbi:MAG: hypothetical protein IPJ76_18020 [Flavobacteriales bacterium]|nr:MAG: hypothetical protein IPJ76_18020 [Flavobacteriales bacterium]
MAQLITFTTYGYTYDRLGRLLYADGIQGDAVFGHQPNDDERYAFDRIGNFQWLQRSLLNDNGDVEKHAWDYDYATANNRLLRVLAQPGTQAPDRVYTYDHLGNLLSDDFRGLDHTTYGRANLPFHIARNLPGNPKDHYLYNAADMRIHKMEDPGDINEFYLRDVLGRELGVLNLNGVKCEELEDLTVADWQWYVFGTTRFARIKPLCTQQAALYTSDLARNEQAAQELRFANLRNVLLSLNHPQNGFPADVTIYYFDPPYNGQWYMTEAGYNAARLEYPDIDAEHNTLDILIPSTAYQFSVPRVGLKSDLLISVEEILNLGPPNTRGGSTIWTYTFMADLTLPPVTYYEHDHLGNTRVTYTPVVTDCGGVGGPPSIDYTLEHVADYYPYGKILREYDGAPEKYLSTHHERDQETGLDYRGARYYDSDAARFLNLDPLADEFANWSAYNYVLGNPISLLDPDGRSAGDFLRQDGTLAYTDGQNDGRVYVLADNKEADALNKRWLSGENLTRDDAKSAVELPSYYVRSKMGKAVTASQSPSADAGDRRGGYHEEGGQYGTTGGLDLVVPAAPGKAFVPPEIPSIDVGKHANPELVPDDFLVAGDFHTHPDVFYRQFVSDPEPSDVDIRNARTDRAHYVLAVRNNTVYKYNNKGIQVTLPLDVFTTYKASNR